MEIQRQLAEYDRKHAMEIDALVLWVLHTQLGWGVKRLKRFYDSFSDEIDALVDRYQMDKEDDIWLCTYKLKECGVDLEVWNGREKEMFELIATIPIILLAILCLLLSQKVEKLYQCICELRAEIKRLRELNLKTEKRLLEAVRLLHQDEVRALQRFSRVESAIGISGSLTKTEEKPLELPSLSDE